jgi:hypothetical protein
MELNQAPGRTRMSHVMSRLGVLGEDGGLWLGLHQAGGMRRVIQKIRVIRSQPAKPLSIRGRQTDGR